MSPDDIFAAQFWPWPDPAIKRDNQGRVLFVNAAFLQLYGGTVQDWTGNVVGEWPAPQGPGQPYRFETRIPMSHEQGEQVYDWMEMTLADGHAFALARNVTALMTPPEPQPGAAMPAQHMPNNAAMLGQGAMVQNTAQNQMADIYAADQSAAATDPAALSDNVQTPMADVNMAAAQAAPEIPSDAPAATMSQEVVVPSMQTAPNEAVPSLDTAQYGTENFDAGHFDPAPAAELAVQANIESAQAEVAPLTQETQSPPERTYERRALPIEDDSAVLGNNWRDAVIAKAVGADAMADAAAPEPEQPAAQDTPDMGDGVKRILLAEDNAINALLTRTLLEAEGHIVETVQDGQLAVEAMKTSTYDLIFMDMRMPNMDGLEATRKIRTLSNVSKDLPIIALTANAFDDDRNACFDSGMNDFMTKPVSAEELSEMVGQWTRPKEERMAS